MTELNRMKTDIEERNATIGQLQNIVSTKSAEAAMGGHVTMVEAWVNEGRITPAEKEAVLDVLSHAYRADSTTKGDTGFVSSVQKWVEARAVNPILSTPAAAYNNVGSLNGGVANGLGGSVDPTNIERLKRYAEIN